MNDTSPVTGSTKPIGLAPARERSVWHWPRAVNRVFASAMFAPLAALGGTLVLLAVTSAMVARAPAYSGGLIALQAMLALIGVTMVALVVRAIRRELLAPLADLRRWALEIQSGNLDARISEPARGEFAELARDINDVGEALLICNSKMEAEVERQTQRLAEKTRYLEILYDVTASINAARNIDDLLERVLHTLREIVEARAACVRLCTESGQMRLIASIGLGDEVVARERVLPLDQCVCGQAITNGDVRVQPDMSRCTEMVGRKFFDSDKIQMVAVPLLYRDRTVGVYNLFVDDEDITACEDMRDLFTTIGRHLGTAIEKSRLDEEAKRLSIIDERTRLAHDLHDSLAQTLASVRFQVRVLDQTLHQGDESTLWQELERLETSLDEAHTELRQLIAHFRAPVADYGLVPSIEELISRVCKDSGINVFVQNEWENAKLPVETEMQVLRIIQESLNNVCKHSRAQNARVMLRNDGHGNFRVLIEDDGVGFQKRVMKGPPGEHIGLSIMQDRARHLGGKLQIESEPGEGTRIVLTFHGDQRRGEGRSKASR
jgi:two-component system nitrate/nitrite sensor histidine kinase NarX